MDIEESLLFSFAWSLLIFFVLLAFSRINDVEDFADFEVLLCDSFRDFVESLLSSDLSLRNGVQSDLAIYNGINLFSVDDFILFTKPWRRNAIFAINVAAVACFTFDKTEPTQYKFVMANITSELITS